VHLDNCIWRAHDAIQFSNNSAIGYVRADLFSYDNSSVNYPLHGGALSAVNSHATFKGLNVVGNSAAFGGGMYLEASMLTLSGGRFLCTGNAAGCDGSCLYVGFGSTVLWNSSSACITGNTALDNNNILASGSQQCQQHGIIFQCQSPDYSWETCILPGPILGALSISGNSSVHFIGHAQHFGGNTGIGSMADIVVFNDPVNWDNVTIPCGLECDWGWRPTAPVYKPSSYNGFACDEQAPHTDGVYTMTGDVCGCMDDICTCQPPAQWEAASCACA
jgi:hypothetical protein